MKNNLKKGFTLVELVIVIAVIAILSAVLIPTFSNLVQKANVSADTQLVKNLNTALSLDNKEHETMYDALKATKEYGGFDVAKINASAEIKKVRNEILWDSVNDVFCYLNEDKVEYIPESTDTPLSAGDCRLWRISSTVDPDSKYSTYLYNYSGNGVITTTKGIDCGDCTSIISITYTNESPAQEVIIRTQGNMLVLTIYGPQDHIDHYGYAMVTNVVSVNSSASYHEYGTSSTLAVTSGKVVIEETGVVLELKEQDYAANTALNIPAVTKSNTVTSTGNVLNSSISSVQGTTSLEIDNLAKLEAFRDATNSGQTFAGITINLNCDIYLKEAWKPISNYSRNNADVEYLFAGIFNGNGHKIYGLTNKGLSTSDVNTGRNDSTPANKAEITYGFFATVNDATIKNIVFENVAISNVGFGALLGDSVGACVGCAFGDTSIDNITVSGSLEAWDCVGGILGREKNGTSLTITNCTNYASIFSYQGACGIVGRSYTNGCVLTISGCVNEGNVTSDWTQYSETISNYDACYAAGIIDIRSEVTGTISGCTNKGVIKRVNPTASNTTGHIGQITIDVDNKLTKTNNKELGSTAN